MPNPFCFMELTSRDLDGAKEFYGQLFDWQISPLPSAKIPYLMVDTGAEPGGGILPPQTPNMPNTWLMYVLVDDVAASTDKVRELGGKVLLEKSPVPGTGWYAVMADPQGAVFGLWENKK